MGIPDNLHTGNDVQGYFEGLSPEQVLLLEKSMEHARLYCGCVRVHH
jgi:hypothetical protein